MKTMSFKLFSFDEKTDVKVEASDLLRALGYYNMVDFIALFVFGAIG